jgi:hypothetical protein
MHILDIATPSIKPRALAFLTLFVVGACTVNAGPKYPDLGSFCNARASAECSPNVLLACAAPSASACTSKRAPLCIASAPSGTQYNPNAAEDCVAKVSSAYADAKVTLDESAAIDAACLPVFDGPGRKDASCQADANCQVSTGLRCVLSAGTTQGTCQTPRPIQGGASCAAVDARCIDGYHCGSTAHCDIDGALNDICSAAVPCGAGLLCSTGAVCVAKSADGSACASGDECAHGICNKASTAAMGLCVSQVTLAPNEPFCIDSR